MTLNPLANPKGVKLCCELCSKPAFIYCTKCRVTYYCDSEHQNIDWLGIHEKICQLLIPLRTPTPFTSGSEEDRLHQKQQQILRQKQMIDLTQTAGQKMLFEGKYEYAIPAAMQSLKFSIDVYGVSSLQLVPSYLILGEACIGLGRLTQAEEYLSQAQWTVLKTPDCKDDMKSHLYRNLGMLYASKGQLEDALRYLAEDIYHASCVFGTDDIKTSGGYFHMANIFHEQNKFAAAFSMYTQLTTIWHDHLQNLVEQRIRVPEVPTGIGPAQIATSNVEYDTLDEAEGAEAIQVLHAILQLRESKTSSNAAVMMKIYYTLAMLYLVLEEHQRDVSPATLMAVHKFTRTQKLMVANTPELLEIIGKGAAIAIKECQKQFHNRKWNCSSYSSESVFGKILNKACRETAFIHGITSAGVTYTLTENCAKGSVKRCQCNRNRVKRSQKSDSYWINESCTNAIAYGYQQGKIFVDSTEMSHDFGAAVNLHNNEAGRQAVVDSMKVQCKCHGLSGNCNLQMCRKVLPLFNVIGRKLKERYDVATKVIPVQKRVNRRITRAHLKNENEVHQQSTKRDLIYFEESPDFCTFNLSNGSLGTRGRYCNASLSAKGVDGCELLCCGRDWKTETRMILTNCKCRFKYCCTVECEKCKVTKTFSYCN